MDFVNYEGLISVLSKSYPKDSDFTNEMGYVYIIIFPQTGDFKVGETGNINPLKRINQTVKSLAKSDKNYPINDYIALTLHCENRFRTESEIQTLLTKKHIKNFPVELPSGGKTEFFTLKTDIMSSEIDMNLLGCLLIPTTIDEFDLHKERFEGYQFSRYFYETDSYHPVGSVIEPVLPPEEDEVEQIEVCSFEFLLDEEEETPVTEFEWSGYLIRKVQGYGNQWWVYSKDFDFLISKFQTQEKAMMFAESHQPSQTDLTLTQSQQKHKVQVTEKKTPFWSKDTILTVCAAVFFTSMTLTVVGLANDRKDVYLGSILLSMTSLGVAKTNLSSSATFCVD